MKKRQSLPKFPHQFFYFTGLRFRQFLSDLSGRLVPPHVAVYEKAQGFWTSRAIVAACELNIPDFLATGPKGIKELARLSGADEAHLYRLLRMLAGEGIFRERKEEIFENNRLSDTLVTGEGSIRNLIMHQFSDTHLKLFAEFNEVIRTGESYSRKVLGKPVFQFLEENPERNLLYNKAMDDSSIMIALAVTSSYNFKNILSIIDIGGGHGIVLAQILRKHKKMKGILFDRGHVVEEAGEVIRHFGLQDRIQIVEGDFFGDIPAGADAYFMKNVLHAFNDEDCETLLGKIHGVMLPHSKLLIVESVIYADNRPAFGKRLDLLMMAGTEGGKERTREEFETLLSGSGFRLNRIIRTVAPFSIIEAVKN